ncbi:hypothetical protein DMC30DRAFT_402568 [Rhodotorula diobovata]|uniref:CFA20 domain-containing protein n=1 Tax=Rhodotorula diobovata TaxID=5288 RepID=A0A5C5FS94_9BASI|nr:hypothetical protein DMC30DRAFT_402568 [Rhodotorula diobovata]
MLLDRVVQPSTISLFSSTSSHPTLLARCTAAADSTADSFVCLLNDATDSHEEILASKSPSSATNPSSRAESLARLRRGLPDHAKDLDGQVLHLQAPDCRTTSIRWGSLSPETARQHGLGVELPAVHFQLKHLEQTMYLEVAVLDERGEVTVVRCSTFQETPELLPATADHPRLLHLPLRFPSSDTSVPLLTSWCHVALPLQSLFASLTPPVRLKSVTGVAVHATCRLRRVWFSQEDAPAEIDEDLLSRGVMPEMALFASEDRLAAK